MTFSKLILNTGIFSILLGLAFVPENAKSKSIGRQLKPKVIGSSVWKEKSISIEDVMKQEKDFIKFKTTSKYDKVALEFEGLPSDKFISFFGGDKIKKIKFKAIDGYAIELTKAEWDKFPFLFVVKTNGEFLSPKEKGTFRLMWDFDGKKETSAEVFAPKAIWQITEIEFFN